MSDKKLVLIAGESKAGKTTSLKDLLNPEGVAFMNTEGDKGVPFRGCEFNQVVVTDPLSVPMSIEGLQGNPDFHTLIIDSLTYLMDMYESQYVLNSSDGQKAWGAFQQFFKRMMQESVAASDKNIIFTAHTKQVLSADRILETKVPVKGALKDCGIESYFSCVIGAKRIPITRLKGFENDLLTITKKDEICGYKRVFQTDITADTVHERISSPLDMWTPEETYIDNNAQYVLNRLNEYYS